MRRHANPAASCLTLALAFLLAAGGCEAERPGAWPVVRADMAPNTWVRLQDHTPKNTWETGVAWDRDSGLIVEHGGHVLGSYAQSNYTWLYDLRTNSFRESHAAARPQRRCLVELDYIDTLGRVVTTQGGSGHGSVPQGGLGGDYKMVFKGDPRGPWLYDASADRWEDCRLLGRWRRQAHCQTAYDASSDALVWIAGDKLGVFEPWSNRVAYRDLPESLRGRLSYAIAADPVSRRIVLFGGTGPLGWIWVGDKPRAQAYRENVRADTWLYDVSADRWKQVVSDVHPPLGQPLDDHIKLPMAYDSATGTCLLVINPVSEYTPDRRTWGPAQLWSFDVAAERWTRIETSNPPPLGGLTTYAPDADLLVLFGGGDDGKVEGNVRPALSRCLYVCRPRLPGRPPVPPSPVGGVRAEPYAIPLLAGSDGDPKVKHPSIRVSWRSSFDGEHEIWRADAAPLPGAYRKVGIAPAGAKQWLDLTVEPGRDYGYRVVEAGGRRPSAVALTRPCRPGGLVASVESANRVVLTWARDGQREHLRYNVYRARGAEVETGKGERLTPEPVMAHTLTDAKVDLSDGVARAYWVCAVDGHGVEGGPSPLAWTMPDAPASLKAVRKGDTIELTWQPPPGVKLAGVNLYHQTTHLNTHEQPADVLKAWWGGWKKVNAEPVADGRFVFTRPTGAANPHDYFYLRAENPLGQEGFYTDIVSATDARFRPACD
ncbi:MAG: hypothetical protein BIFFINMI_00170 [Phycisphaerae bacterium]|nr:hypothetical protein [Phycisphaerae bacterium]